MKETKEEKLYLTIKRHFVRDVFEKWSIEVTPDAKLGLYDPVRGTWVAKRKLRDAMMGFLDIRIGEMRGDYQALQRLEDELYVCCQLVREHRLSIWPEKQ